jgi:hypothetical protein
VGKEATKYGMPLFVIPKKVSYETLTAFGRTLLNELIIKIKRIEGVRLWNKIRV